MMAAPSPLHPPRLRREPRLRLVTTLPAGTPPAGAGPGGFERGGGFRRRGGFGLGPGGGGGAGPEESDLMRIEGDKVSLQFPNNTITDILGIYERLTGKTLVKDSTIFEGQTISLVTPVPVEKEEAIKLIEASMLTNGYAIIANPDGKSARILPTRTRDAKELQFSQGVHFYQNAKELPNNETIVSYFMKLEHLDPGQAAQILSNHVGLNVYGRMTPVTTLPGLLITGKRHHRAPTRADQRRHRSAGYLRTQSSPSSSLSSTLTLPRWPRSYRRLWTPRLTDKEQKGLSTNRGSGPTSTSSRGGPPGAPAPAPVAAPAAGGGATPASLNATNAIKKPQAKSQVVADTRLNQLLVVAEPGGLYPRRSSLVTEFDKPVEVPEAYERMLKNIFSIDVLSVLADLLKDTSKSGTQLPGGGTVSANQQQALVSTSNNLLTGRSSSTNQRGGSFTNATAGTSTTGTASSGAQPDQLQEATQDNAPVAVLVNKTRIIADPLANAIIVIGPKEDKDKVDQLLDKLDQRPIQVYLATVIGQLTLGDNFNAGIDYLQTFANAGNGAKGVASSFIQATPLVTNKSVADMRNNIVTTVMGPQTGFNLYGQVSNDLGLFVNALESTNDFRVISRPCVFALNNRKAVILSGQSIPVPTQSLTTAATATTANAGNVTTTIDYKDVVLKLEVIPLINPDGEITLKIAQTNDTENGTVVVAQNTVPVINTEQLTTTATVPDGHTIVLGGLIAETEQKNTGGLPILHNIPFLGKLFENNVKVKNRNELMIFIQPRVVFGTKDLAHASYYEDIRSDVGGDSARIFPEKVWPKAQVVPEANPKPNTQVRRSFWNRVFNRPNTGELSNGRDSN